MFTVAIPPFSNIISFLSPLPLNCRLRKGNSRTMPFLGQLHFVLVSFFVFSIVQNERGKVFVQSLSGTDLSMSIKSVPSVASPAIDRNCLIGEMDSSELVPQDQIRASKPANMTYEEWKTRLEAAILYRLFYARGWDEEIINHISIKLPSRNEPGNEGEEKEEFLLNPYGLTYGEIRASNLLKVDINGNIIEDDREETQNPNEKSKKQSYTFNKAGFIIHSALHAHRKDAQVIIHTHETNCAAISSKKSGLTYNSLYGSLLYGRVAYHDFEGITVRDDEKKRLVTNLGQKDILILRNHGVLVVAKDIYRGFFDYFALLRAAQIQVLTESMANSETISLSEDILKMGLDAARKTDKTGAFEKKILQAACRRIQLQLKDVL